MITERIWWRDAVAAALTGGAITALFALTGLDVRAASLFYHPRANNPWELASQLPWSLLYRSAPWITASLVLAGLAGLLIGVWRARPMTTRIAVFVLLCVLVGPGILVNAVFKDHWGRPRPRDIVQFGGATQYVVAPLPGPGGASCPCGHCSVGFLYAVGWWIWRRRQPRLAAASLAVGLATGTALGVGRMAAGGHFLSDVAWSGFISLGIAHLLYHYVLRIPRHAALLESPSGRGVRATRAAGAHRRHMADSWIAGLSAAGGIIVLLALSVFPHGVPLEEQIHLASLPQPPQAFQITARVADVHITVVDSASAVVSIRGELHGFGLPTSRLAAVTGFDSKPLPTLTYRIEQSGWFTDLSGFTDISVPAGSVRRIVVRVGHGDISVRDATRERMVASGRLRLDLSTRSGAVERPPGARDHAA